MSNLQLSDIKKEAMESHIQSIYAVVRDIQETMESHVQSTVVRYTEGDNGVTYPINLHSYQEHTGDAVTCPIYIVVREIQ